MRFTIRLKLLLIVLLMIVTMLVLNFYSVITEQRFLRDEIGGDSIFKAEEMLKRMDQSIYLRIEFLQAYIHHVHMERYLIQSNRKFKEFERDQQKKKRLKLYKTQASTHQESSDHELSTIFRKHLIEFYTKKYGQKLYGEVFVTNKYGVNVAQSGETTDYLQDDETWWQVSRNNGYYVGPVEFDQSSQMHGLTIGIRVNDDKGRFLGVLKVVLILQKKVL